MLQPKETPLPERFDNHAPWNRQPFDGPEAWPAFLSYLKMPRPRSVQALAHRLGLPYEKMRKWYRDNGWKLRTKAFEDHIQNNWNDAVVATVVSSAEEVAERHLSIVRKGLELAHDQVDKLLNAAKQDMMHGLLTPSETIRLLETCIKLERLVMGDSTGKLDVNLDLSALNEEELITLQQAQQKLLKESNNE